MINRNLTNILLSVLALVVAITPVLLMHITLRWHAGTQTETALNGIASRMLVHADSALSEAADALAQMAPLADRDCASVVKPKLAALVYNSTYLKDLVVLNGGGLPTCFTTDVPLSGETRTIYRPAKARNLSVAMVQTTDAGRPFTQVMWIDGSRQLVAVLAPESLRLDIIPTEWRAEAQGTIRLDDNTLVSTVPINSQPVVVEATNSDERMWVEVVSERFPIKVAASVPYATVWDSYSNLLYLVNIGGGIMSFMFLMLALQVIRRPASIDDAMVLGIRRREFIPYYQPVFDIQSGRLVGCEVLVRWKKRDGTVVPPGLFIQRAEESGLAIEMTQQLMEITRDEMADLYGPRPYMKLAFNLFADHFDDMSIVDDIRETFKGSRIRYSQLVFEVTERYPLPNLNRARLAINAMQELGCRVALDDAGTGHGGLAYLQKLGMDQIKIDKLFVDTILPTSTAVPIIDSLIEIGRRMGMEIVAEGIENEAQLAYLKKKGVHTAQGYLFAQPLPGAQYAKLIEGLAPVIDASEEGAQPAGKLAAA